MSSSRIPPSPRMTPALSGGAGGSFELQDLSPAQQATTGPGTGSRRVSQDAGRPRSPLALHPASFAPAGPLAVLASQPAAPAYAATDLPKISSGRLAKAKLKRETREKFCKDLVAFHNRPIDKATLAELSNKCAPNRFARDFNLMADSEALTKIALKEVKRFGIGISTAEYWADTQRRSFVAGFFVPVGGMLMNMMLWPMMAKVGPNLSTRDNALTRSLLGFGAAAVTSGIQPFVVQAQEGSRQANAPSIVVPTKEASLKLTKRQLNAACNRQAKIVEAGARLLATELSSLCERHGVPAPADETHHVVFGQMEQLLGRLDAEGRAEVSQMVSVHEEQRVELLLLKLQQLGYGARAEREKAAREFQKWFRTVRAGSGLPAIFMKPLPTESSWLDHIRAHSRWTLDQTTTLTSGIGAVTIMTHGAPALLDEGFNAQPRDAALAMMYGDYYNEEGLEDRRHGRHVKPSGISEVKARKFLVGKEQSTVSRTVKILEQRRSRLKAKIKKLNAKVAKLELRAARDPERGGAGNAQLARKLASKYRRLNELDLDIPKLKPEDPDAVPDIMGLRDGGEAQRLLDSALERFPLTFRLTDGFEKLVSGDYPKQFIERSIQMFSGGGLTGNFFSAVGLPILQSALGGSKQMSLSKQLGFQVLSIVGGLVAAKMLYLASVAKNQARESETPVPWYQFLGGGIMMPLHELHDYFMDPTKQANEKMKAAMEKSWAEVGAAIQVLEQWHQEEEAQRLARDEDITLTGEQQRALLLQAAADEDGAGPSALPFGGGPAETVPSGEQAGQRRRAGAGSSSDSDH